MSSHPIPFPPPSNSNNLPPDQTIITDQTPTTDHLTTTDQPPTNKKSKPDSKKKPSKDSSPIICIPLKDHIDRLKDFKSLTSSILAECIPGADAANATMSITWEAIFDFLCDVDGKLSLSELNTLSGIINKLIGSYNTIKTIEMKANTQALKNEEISAKTLKIKESLSALHSDSSDPCALSAETVSLIMNQLKLL